jgi:hypothetical protein
MGVGVETRFSWLRRVDKVGVNSLGLRTDAFSHVLRGESQVIDPRLHTGKAAIQVCRHCYRKHVRGKLGALRICQELKQQTVVPGGLVIARGR